MFAMNFAREELELDQNTLYYVLSTVDGCLNEMEQLFLKLEENFILPPFNKL
jgi:hypothetical protein